MQQNTSNSDQNRFDRATPKRYASAVDTWIVALVFTGPVVSLCVAAYLFSVGRTDDGWICTATGVGLIVLLWCLISPCYYEIYPDRLYVRMGFLWRNIRMDRFESAEPSSSPQSGMGMSLRRVRICYAGGSLLISPAQRDAFLEEIRSVKRAYDQSEPDE
ncbi:MAG: PH domain-containing protein [Planctomycetota bacterium]